MDSGDVRLTACCHKIALKTLSHVPFIQVSSHLCVC